MTRNPESLKSQIQILEQVIQRNPHLTLIDAAAQSGLPLEDVRQAMYVLMERYHCRLRVTQGGDLIYDFGKSLQRRQAKSWAERWQEIQHVLWRAFQIFFKAWIGITLVVYFVMFVVILVGIIVASIAARQDDRNKGGQSVDLSHLFFLVMRLFQEIWIWNTLTRRTVYKQDQYGFPYKQHQGRHAVIGNRKSKSFVASVYDFVFGPTRPAEDPLNNYKELAAFARKQQGIVVIPEVKALAGWNEEQANSFLTECLVRYDGQARVSENGVLYGDFDELRRSLSQEKDHPIVWYWAEYEAPYVLTGNSMSRNTQIFGMNLFNLLFATFFITQMKAPDAESIRIVLGWIPFTFSVIFFLVPALRYFYVRKKEKQRIANNLRKLFMKNLFHSLVNGKKKLHTAELIAVAEKEKIYQPTHITQQVLQELIIDWQGESQATESGEVIYHFEQAAFALEEARRLRMQRSDRADLGDIYFEQ